ncbi:2-nitropropane dioxygenase [Violaceomyces palustris]|uniref:2-nitropropane dioxygenase n=1 Tax=Violaceomyces palustris TaxID=1673888 RepID=A0ACD0NNP0_9BASI|nr:2-nitropropane dioxygenase [Violaceomyces palustris]
MTEPPKERLFRLHPSMRYPIVCGPMANASGGRLSSRVSRSGGLGFVGGGYLSPHGMEKELCDCREELGWKEGKGRLEVGVGLLCWRLSQIPEEEAIEILKVVIRFRVRAVWLSFGDREQMVRWCTLVREMEGRINGEEEDGLRLWIMIGKVEELDFTLRECEPDVLVVQGIEAGGHGDSTSPPLQNLLSTISNLLPAWSPSLPLVGAGGLSDGRSLLSILSLHPSISAGVFGTRFLLAEESTYSPAQKSLLVQASRSKGELGTVRTLAFDLARGTLGWPQGVDGRGLFNTTVHEYQQLRADGQGQQSLESIRQVYAQAVERGDVGRIVTWAGTGIGRMDARVQPVLEIVQQIADQLSLAVRELGRYA